MKRNTSTAFAVVAAIVVLAMAMVSRHDRAVQRTSEVQALAKAVTVLNHSPAVANSGVAGQGASDRVTIAANGPMTEQNARRLTAQYLSAAKKLNHGHGLTSVAVTIQIHRQSLGGNTLYTGVKNAGTMRVVWRRG